MISKLNLRVFQPINQTNIIQRKHATPCRPIIGHAMMNLVPPNL